MTTAIAARATHLEALPDRRAAGGYGTLRDSLAHAARRMRGREHHEPEEIWALRDVSFEVEEGEVVGHRSGATAPARARCSRS